MGLSIGFGGRSYSSYDKSSSSPRVNVVERVVPTPVYVEVASKKLPNPDPYNYVINKYDYVDEFLLVDITYPDCNNYEGRKIMVYENVVIDDLKKQVSIDPHFSSNKRFHSPIARFEPTTEGWSRAIKFAESVSK